MMKESTVPTTKTLDDVIRQCGGFGRFQWFNYFFLVMLEVAASLVSFYYVFGAAEPEHRCRLPASIWPNDNQYNPTNTTYKTCLQENIPMNDHKWDQCHLWNSTNSNTSLIDCSNGWVFDRSIFGYTFTEEASLVCAAKPKKSWLSTMLQTAGVLIVVIGSLADRFGRKPTIIACTLILLIVCLLLQTLMQWVPMSVDTKFVLLIINQFIAGLILSAASLAFVLMIEMTSSEYRSLAGNIALAFFALGGILIAFFAYFTYHWQKLLWTITLFLGITHPYLYFLPESPLYLYSTKQYSKLEIVLRRIAKGNRRSDAEWYPIFHEFISSQTSQIVIEKKLTFGEIIRQLLCHRTNTLRLIISSLIAFTGMLLYIKISYGLATMSISPYLGILIGAVVEVFGYIAASILMSTKLGRKYSLMSFTGLTCLCVVLIPTLTKRSAIATVIISQLGKFAISASLATTWIFISELFPTSIRGGAIGITSAIGRIGAITAPIIDSSVNEQYLPITFYIYGSLALLVLFLTVVLPETKNMSLDNTDNFTTKEDGKEKLIFPSVNSVDIEI